MSSTECGHVAGAVVCGVLTGRAYLTGARCSSHTPAALAGRPETVPDPTRTLEGLRRAGGADPDRAFTPAGPTAIDTKAISSGKRRSTPAAYRAAQSP